MTATTTACVSPGNGGGRRGLSLSNSLFRFPLLVLITASLERKGLGCLCGLRPRPRWSPSRLWEGRCFQGPHCSLPGNTHLLWTSPGATQTRLSPPSLDTLKSWGHIRIWLGEVPKKQMWLMDRTQQLEKGLGVLRMGGGVSWLLEVVQERSR